MTIRYDDKVAIVTGAGHGLGRSHALALAVRGAKVVVNDLGGNRDGTGGSSEASLSVVAEIKAAGGEAIANGADVANFEEVEAMVQQTMDKWGRVDILINNAGILRDKSFSKSTLDDFRLVMDVHMMGTVHCTKACWNIMKQQGYGRIVVTTSASGLYGNFGQANYSSAKMGVVGLMNTLVQEGRKYDIRVNALAPSAGTRMMEGLIADDAFELLNPESVTPAVLFLVSENAPNRSILGAGAGTFATTHIFETEGLWLASEERTPENIAANWAQISDKSSQKEPHGASEQTVKFITKSLEGLGITP